MNTAGYIDVHHHILPPFYRDALLSAGLSEVDGAPLPDWTAPDMVSMMDDRGIEVALVSLPPPGVAFGDRRATVKLTRRCNEFAAELVAGRPRRLGAFGSLPLPDVDAALDEIRYLYDVLRLDGVALTSNVDGVYLDWGRPGARPLGRTWATRPSSRSSRSWAGGTQSCSCTRSRRPSTRRPVSRSPPGSASTSSTPPGRSRTLPCTGRCGDTGRCG